MISKCLINFLINFLIQFWKVIYYNCTKILIIKYEHKKWIKIILQICWCSLADILLFVFIFSFIEHLQRNTLIVFSQIASIGMALRNKWVVVLLMKPKGRNKTTIMMWWLGKNQVALNDQVEQKAYHQEGEKICCVLLIMMLSILLRALNLYLEFQVI